MHVIRTGLVLAGLTAGAAGVDMLHSYWTNDPSIVLTPYENLPLGEISLGTSAAPTLICGGEYSPANPCDTTTALGRYASKNTQIPVAANQINDSMRVALRSAEDRRFVVLNPEYKDQQHIGVDGVRTDAAITKFIKAKISKKQVTQGASTITMDDGEWRYGYGKPGTEAGKTIEMRTALTLELYYTKEEIETDYLNRVYFGRGAYGIEAAALAYFGIHASDLSLQQSIVLAAAVRAPSNVDITFNPSDSPEQQAAAKALEYKSLHTEYLRVLNAIKSNKYDDFGLSDEDYAILRDTPAENLGIRDYGQVIPGLRLIGAAGLAAGGYINKAMDQAANISHISREELQAGGYIVYVNMNRKYQEAAANVVHFANNNSEGYIAALTAVQMDGKVVAMANEGDFNFAAATGGSDGSSNKLKIAAAAIENGIDPTIDPNDSNRGRLLVNPSVVLAGADVGGTDWTIDTGNGCKRLGLGAPPCQESLYQGTGVSDNELFGQLMGSGGKPPGYLAPRVYAIDNGLYGDMQGNPVAAAITGAGGASTLGEAASHVNLLHDGIGIAPYFTSMVQKISDGSIVGQYSAPAPRQVIDPTIAHQVVQLGRAPLEEPYGTAYGAIKVPPNTAFLKTGTGINGESGSGSTDLWANGAVCDTATGGVGFSVRIGHEDAPRPLVGQTSHDAARLIGAFVDGAELGRDGCQLPGGDLLVKDSAPA